MHLLEGGRLKLVAFCCEAMISPGLGAHDSHRPAAIDKFQLARCPKTDHRASIAASVMSTSREGRISASYNQMFYPEKARARSGLVAQQRPGERDPPGDEGNPTERRDGAKCGNAGDGQQVEAS